MSVPFDQVPPLAWLFFQQIKTDDFDINHLEEEEEKEKKMLELVLNGCLDAVINLLYATFSFRSMHADQEK